MSRNTLFAVTLFYIALRCSACVSGPCEYTLYPVPFEDATYTTPNSVCIYPDGRTSLADATFGNLAINLDVLQKLSYNTGLYYTFEWADHGMLLGDSSSSLRICGREDAYLQHSGQAYGFADVPIYGGGHSAIDENGMPIPSSIVLWAPVVCGTQAMAVSFNSPDINGDLMINLSDTVLLMQDMNGSYNYRSDFNYDAQITAADVSILVAALGAHCP